MIPAELRDQYHTHEEVMERLQKCRSTIWEYRQAGLLKPKKDGRRLIFPKSQVDKLIHNLPDA